MCTTRYLNLFSFQNQCYVYFDEDSEPSSWIEIDLGPCPKAYVARFYHKSQLAQFRQHLLPLMSNHSGLPSARISVVSLARIPLPLMSPFSNFSCTDLLTLFHGYKIPTYPCCIWNWAHSLFSNMIVLPLTTKALNKVLLCVNNVMNNFSFNSYGTAVTPIVADSSLDIQTSHPGPQVHTFEDFVFTPEWLGIHWWVWLMSHCFRWQSVEAWWG